MLCKCLFHCFVDGGRLQEACHRCLKLRSVPPIETDGHLAKQPLCLARFIVCSRSAEVCLQGSDTPHFIFPSQIILLFFFFGGGGCIKVVKHYISGNATDMMYMNEYIIESVGTGKKYHIVTTSVPLRTSQMKNKTKQNTLTKISTHL